MKAGKFKEGLFKTTLKKPKTTVNQLKAHVKLTIFQFSDAIIGLKDKLTFKLQIQMKMLYNFITPID